MHAETNALVREAACPEREVSSTVECALPDTTGRGAVRVLESHKIESQLDSGKLVVTYLVDVDNRLVRDDT